MFSLSLLLVFSLLSSPLPLSFSASIPHSLSLSRSQLIYVMPSTSGRVASYPKRADKLKFFNELKELRDDLRKKKGLKPATVVYGVAAAASASGASGSGSPKKASRSKK